MLDQTPREATTATLLIVAVTAVAGAIGHSHRGTVQWRVAAIFGAGAAVGAVGGTALNRTVGEQALLVAFGVLMVVAALALVRRQPAATRRARPIAAARVVLLGLAVGVLTGFLGVGGGFVIVPVLVLLLGLPIAAAIGTSLVVIALASLTALAGHLAVESIDWPLTLVFASSAAAGALAGARLCGVVPTLVLTRVFAVLVAGLGVFLIAKSA